MKNLFHSQLICFMIYSLLLFAISFPVYAQDNAWKVWVKTSPCSGRTDWISVAKENPTGGGNFFYLASNLFPGTGCTNTGCTFTDAMAVASTLRLSSQFSNYCCHDYSVWKNNQTGNMTVVLGKFGTAGNGWSFVQGDLCCEEAEALSGIPGACSGTIQKKQPDPKTITCWPGSYSAWNVLTLKFECYCNPGLVWNNTRTACVDSQELVKNADCSVYPGSYAAWNVQTQKVECWCPAGKIWNATRTACIDNTITEVSCWPGSHAVYNLQTNRTECFCNEGLVWNSTRTACVDPQELVKNTDCSAYPGSYAAWNTQTQRVECWCPEGKIWNATNTACIENSPQVSCWPGSHAAVNPQTNRTECFCDAGLVWNDTKTACVEPGKEKKITDSTNPVNQSCSDADAAAFAKISGSWKSYRMQITIGGSCNKVTGTWKVTEWCEGVDETYNASTARINGSFTGKMQGGYLQVNYQSPPSPHNSAGTKGASSCNIGSNGLLTCGFGCSGDLKKQ